MILAMMRSPRRSVSRSSAVYADDARSGVVRRFGDGFRPLVPLMHPVWTPGKLSVTPWKGLHARNGFGWLYRWSPSQESHGEGSPRCRGAVQEFALVYKLYIGHKSKLMGREIPLQDWNSEHFLSGAGCDGAAHAG